MMAALKGLVVLFAVRITLVASLKTKKDLMENVWRDELAPREGTGKDKDPSGTYDKSSLRSKFQVANWCDATVTSNLGGFGPDTSAPPALRYANIRGVKTAQNVSAIDMVVTALSGYKTQKPEMNGFDNGGVGSEDDGCFGIINLDDTSGGASADLEFKFVLTGTDTPVQVSHFEFVLYDIDMGPNNTAIESLTIYDGITSYMYAPNHSFSETGDLSSGVTFTATTEGTGLDNPTDPDNLTVEQIRKTFIGYYENVDQFKLTFTVSEGSGGRNFMFAGSSVADDAPEISEECTSGSCVIWGDPHIITFDLHQEHLRQHPKRESLFRTRNWELDELSVQEIGAFWLVKSSTVHIQGRYGPNQKNPDLTSLDAFAVGGPFLNDNVLVFRPLSGAVTWNNIEILSSLPSVFTNRFVNARYHKGAEMVKDGSMAPAIEVNLPRGLKLTINRWASMLEVKIDMCLEEGQDGQCGNFNDNVTDDNEEQIMMRIGQKLLPHECMFERFSDYTTMIHTIPEYESKDAKTATGIEFVTPNPSMDERAEASTDTAKLEWLEKTDQDEMVENTQDLRGNWGYPKLCSTEKSNEAVLSRATATKPKGNILYMNFKAHHVLDGGKARRMFDMVKHVSADVVCLSEALVPNAVVDAGAGNLYSLRENAQSKIVQPHPGPNMADVFREKKISDYQAMGGEKVSEFAWEAELYQMGYRYLIFGNPKVCPWGSNWGNVMIFRERPTKHRVIDLPAASNKNCFFGACDESRTAICATVAGKSVCTTHLEEKSKNVRMGQVQTLLKAEELQSANMPTIVGTMSSLEKANDDTQWNILEYAASQSRSVSPTEAEEEIKVFQQRLDSLGLESLYQNCVSHAWRPTFGDAGMLVVDTSNFDH